MLNRCDVVTAVATGREVRCRPEIEKVRRQGIEHSARSQSDRCLESAQGRFGRWPEDAVGAPSNRDLGRYERPLQSRHLIAASTPGQLGRDRSRGGRTHGSGRRRKGQDRRGGRRRHEERRPDESGTEDGQHGRGIGRLAPDLERNRVPRRRAGRARVGAQGKEVARSGEKWLTEGAGGD